MVDIAHGIDSCEHLSMPERIEVETRMIGIIKRRVCHGFAITVNEADYVRIIGKRQSLYRDAYCKCLRLCVESMTHWGDRYQWSGKVGFVFEAGHKSQSSADAMMKEIFDNPLLRERHRYLQHSFADKPQVPGIQAADLLAWQWATDFKRRLNNKSSRADLLSLLDTPHSVMHFTERILEDYRALADFLYGEGEFPNLATPMLL